MYVRKHLFFMLFFLPTFTLANVLCTANSNQYPIVKDGLIFSKEVSLAGPQGTTKGHILLHKDKQYAYWLVAGQTMKLGNQPPKIMDFYVELHTLKTGVITRAKSGQKDDPLHAQLELASHLPKRQLSLSRNAFI